MRQIAERRRTLTWCTGLGGVLVLWAATAAPAQVPLPVGGPTTTTAAPPSSSSSSTSTTSTSTSSTTTTTTHPGAGGWAPTTTTSTTTTSTAPTSTAPPPPDAPGPAASSGPAPGPTLTPPPGDGGPVGPASIEPATGTIPDWAVAAMSSVKRSGPNGTRRLLELLAPLQGLGFTEQEAALLGFGRFPVAGEASFTDDWWFPRFHPVFHLHQGTDVFAALGTPIRAPFDGVLTKGQDPVGGFDVYLTLPDRTYFFFAHLQRLPDQPDGTPVRQGDVIGWVGDTGNAQGGAPHLHFEYHPNGGAPADPKPLLDAWVADAEAQAPGLVALYASQGPRALVTTRRTRAGGDGPFAAPSRPLADDVLGVVSGGPAAGLQVAADEAARAVARVDWQRVGARQVLRDGVEALVQAVSGVRGAG